MMSYYSETSSSYISSSLLYAFTFIVTLGKTFCRLLDGFVFSALLSTGRILLCH